jgi:protein SCO1/2
LAGSIAIAVGFIAASPAPDPFIGKALQGVVVGVDARAGTVLVRHGPFAGMPGMTMPFAASHAAIAGLRVNERITAVVASTGSPWALRDIAVVASGMPPERYVPLLDIGAAVPELPLIDQNAKPFSFRALGRRVAVVAFIFTRCGDAQMCPLVSAKFARLQQMIDPASMRLVEVTLDPAFDTPAVLRRYGAAFGARPDRWMFATGRVDVIDELSRRLGVVSAPDERAGIVHSEALVVIDANGRIADRVDGNTWTPLEALALARGALGRHENPLAWLMGRLTRGVTAICGRGSSGITVAGAIALFLAISAALGFAFYRAFAMLYAAESRSAISRRERK